MRFTKFSGLRRPFDLPYLKENGQIFFIFLSDLQGSSDVLKIGITSLMTITVAKITWDPL
jgi:hypothetical protein